MNHALRASIPVALCLMICGSTAQAQSLLNESKDDLLKGFDSTKGLSAPPINGPQSSSAAPNSWAPGPAAGAAAGALSQPGTIAPYQFPATAQKGLIQRLIEGAMNVVNVSNADGDGTHIKAPFVNVNVGGSNPGVKVKAPFVNYDTINGPNVKAPFVKYNGADGPQVKAPFVNYNSADGANVKAPFVNVNGAGANGSSAPQNCAPSNSNGASDNCAPPDSSLK